MRILNNLAMSLLIVSSACQAIDTKSMKTYIYDAVASQGGKAENIGVMKKTSG